MAPPSLPGFSSDQREYVQGLTDEFRTFLQENNPNAANNHGPTSKWMQATARRTMRDILFAIPNLSGRNPAVVKEKIWTYLRNWKNYTYKQSLDSAQSPSLFTTSTVPPHPPITKSVTHSIENALQSLVVLDGDISARQLFYLQAPEHYQRAYRKIAGSDEGRGLPSVAIAQKARMTAWADADQELWVRRKRAFEMDIDGNRLVFPSMLRSSIQQNLERGVLGTALVAVMVAFRTENGLQHGISYCGFDSTQKCEIPHLPSQHETLAKIWSSHADAFMPGMHKDEPSLFALDRDEDGYPLLPCLDLDTAVVGEIGKLLTVYMETSWVNSCPSDPSIPALPWGQISTHPHLFFDTTTYSIPYIIGNPIPCKPVHALGLYDALIDLQISNKPFRFHERRKILISLATMMDEVVKNAEKDRENLDDEQPCNSSSPSLEHSQRSFQPSTPSPSHDLPLFLPSSPSREPSTPASRDTSLFPMSSPQPQPQSPNPHSSLNNNTIADGLTNIYTPPITHPSTTHSPTWFQPNRTSTPPPDSSTPSIGPLGPNPALGQPLGDSQNANLQATLSDNRLDTIGGDQGPVAIINTPNKPKRVRKGKENAQGVVGRKSARSRIQAVHGVRLAANGQRSPINRRSGWAYEDDQTMDTSVSGSNGATGI